MCTSILSTDLICAELRLPSLPDLCSFGLTNRAVSSIARVHIFHTLVLYVDVENRLKILQNNPEWCTLIREIQITRRAKYPIARAEGANAGALIAVGRARRELRPARIEWDVQRIVQVNLQQALVDTSFPSAALFVHLHGYRGDTIPYSQHVVSLDAVVYTWSDALWHYRPALLNTPNLVRLKIEKYRNMGSVVINPPPFLQSSTSQELSRESRSFPRLEELDIKYCEFKQDVDYMQSLDWTKLLSLTIDYCNNSNRLLQNLAPRFTSSFPNLRRLRISESSRYWSDKLMELQDLLSVLGQILEAFDPGFEELVFVGPFASLIDIIGVNQGRSLRRLKMHEVESEDANVERIVATIRTVESLGNRCKDLECLYLDVNSVRSGPESDLSLQDIHSLLMGSSVLSSSPVFPHLKSLAICMPVGIAAQTAPSSEEIDAAKVFCRELALRLPPC
jgi:hypothetical protein